MADDQLNQSTADTGSEGTVPHFFAVSIVKLIVLSLATLSFYELYWFYKNWKLIKEREQLDISPFWRAFFAPIFCYSLFSRINESAARHKTKRIAGPGLLALCWFLLGVASRLPDPYWLVSFLTFLCLVPVQNSVNQINRIVAPKHDENGKFSPLNIAAVVIGGLLMALSILVTIFPELEA